MMKKFVIGVIMVITAVALAAGGYYAGTQVQTDSIVSALPKKTIEQTGEKETKENKNDETHKNNEETIVNEPASLKTEVNIIEKNTVTAIQDGWSEVHKANLTLADGSSAVLQLYTSAQTEGNGEFIWDDGNQWVLEVKKDNEYYTLVNKYVQLGEINYVVGTDESDSDVITAITTTGSGMTVEKFTYNGTAFEGQSVYTSGAMNVRASTFRK